jgi:hypothetical protein
MATASMPAPDAQSQPAISPIGRIVGVFFSPKATFEDIVRKPSWVLPVVSADPVQHRREFRDQSAD